MLRLHGSTRRLLTSASILPAISAALFLPTAAAAQTACTSTPGVALIAIECLDGANQVATGSTQLSTTVFPAAQGLHATSGTDLTLTLQPGADGDTIATNDFANQTLSLTSGGTLTVTAPDVNLSGTGLFAIGASLTAPNIDATLGNITGRQLGFVVDSHGTITFAVGDVIADFGFRNFSAPTGINATFGDVLAVNGGFLLQSLGAITLDGGSVTVTGSTGGFEVITIKGFSPGGYVTGMLGDVTAEAAGARGLSITGAVHDLTIGNISTAQDAVIVNAGAGSVDLTTGDVTTSEADAPAITINGTGAIDLTTGVLTTTGLNSKGLDVNGGAGDVDVTVAGASTTATSVEATSTGGAVSVTAGAVTSTLGEGIHAEQQNAVGTGGVSVTANGAVSGTTGISAINAGIGGLTPGTGGVAVATSGPVTGTAGSAIFANISNVLSTGDIDVSVGAGGASGVANVVNAINDGTGGITVAVGGNVVSTAGRAVNIASTNTGATGDIELTSTAGGTITSTGDNAVTIDSKGSGAITVDLADAVTATGGNGIRVTNATAGSGISITTDAVTSTTSSGLVALSTSAAGDMSIVTNGPVTAAFTAISALMGSASPTGNLTIVTNDAVSGRAGVGASTNGSGSISLTTVGPVTATSLVGISALTRGGDLTVTTGDVSTTSLSSPAISVGNVSATGAGDVRLTTNGAITGVEGISTVNGGSGDLVVTTTGPVTGTNSAAMFAEIFDAGSTGNLLVNIGDGGATGEFAGLFITQRGTGTTTVNTIGDVAGTNGDSIHVRALNAGAGTVDVTTAAGTVISSSAGDAINVTSAGSGKVTIVNAADIASSTGGAETIREGIRVDATGSGAVSITNSGTMGSATDRAELGVEANNANGAITVTNTGTIFGQFVGIFAAAINGPITIDSGTVNALGNGLNAITLAGSSCGDVIVNVTGDISAGTAGVYASSCSSGIVTVNAGHTINTTSLAGIGAFFANGGEVLVDGTVNDGTIGAVIFGSGGGALTIRSGGIVNGNIAGDAATETVTIESGGIWNVEDVNDFGGGTDALNNQAGGTLNLAAATTFVGLETLTNSGLINLHTFTLTGTGTFTNAGVIDTSGSAGLAGYTALSNGGTMDLAAGTFSAPVGPFTNSGLIIADEGAATITGQTSFANSDTVSLLDGAVGDVLTIDSSFAGSGASTLAIDASLTAADRLVITGAASGATEVDVNVLGGVVVNTDGILVVDTGTSSANAFVLGDTFGTTLIDLSLIQQGADYFLFATPNANAFQPLLVGAVNQDMWYQSADTFTAYSALRRSDFGADRKDGIGIWAQLYGSHDRHGKVETQSVFGSDVDVDNRVRTDRRGAQAGIDFLAGNSFIVGLTGGYQHAEADQRSLNGGVHAEGHNFGLYGQFGSGVGVYAGALLKKDWNDVKLTNGAFGLADDDPDSTSSGIEAEAGYRWQSGSLRFDVGGGVAYVRTKIDDFTASGIAFDFDRSRSLRGRLGARVGFGGSLAPFVDAKVYHEFEGGDELTLSSGNEVDTIETEGRGTWGRIEAGIGSQGKPGPMLSGWVDLGDVKGLGLRGGFRF